MYLVYHFLKLNLHNINLERATSLLEPRLASKIHPQPFCPLSYRMPPVDPLNELWVSFN